jgi:hypothetical protein
MKVDDNSALIVGDPHGILGQNTILLGFRYLGIYLGIFLGIF